MMKNIEFESPNDWIVKAGARQEGDKIILPIQCLLVPLALASEAIQVFRAKDALNERIKNGLVVVMMVRMADTAYFIRVAKMLIDHNGDSKNLVICQHCLRGELWPTKIKEYRKMANQNIIHKMEEGLPVTPEDLEVVELYYEEMFKHPLTNPISCEAKEGIPFCHQCAKKNKKS